MTVYLIHFERPYTSPNGRKTIQHYLGSTDNLPQRIAAHKSGQGARVMEVITAAGIAWHVDRIWEGGRVLERKLKRHHHAPRLCTACREADIRQRWQQNSQGQKSEHDHGRD